MFSKCVQRLIRDGYYNAKLRKILIFTEGIYKQLLLNAL